MNIMENATEHAVKILQVIDAAVMTGVSKTSDSAVRVDRDSAEHDMREMWYVDIPSCVDYQPMCVSNVLRRPLRQLYESSDWTCVGSKATGLRQMSIARLNSEDVLNETAFAEKFTELVFKVIIPKVLLIVAAATAKSTDVGMQKYENRLIAASAKCRDMKGSDANSILDGIHDLILDVNELAVDKMRYVEWPVIYDDSNDAVYTATQYAGIAIDCITRSYELNEMEISGEAAESAGAVIVEVAASAVQLNGETSDSVLAEGAALMVKSLRSLNFPGIKLMDSLIPI